MFRRPQRLDYFILACMADARGKGGQAENPYSVGDALRLAYQAALTVDVGEIISSGISGGAIKSALRDARIAAIEKTLLSI